MKDEEHAKMFHDYYGQWDYADQLVQAAFSGGNTFGSFTYGNGDFSIFSLVGRERTLDGTEPNLVNIVNTIIVINNFFCL